MASDRLQAALKHIEFTRLYTQGLLDDLTPDEWFWQPPGVCTHVAWQVGHVATAQFALCLLRVRGRRDGDAGIIPADFLDRFKKGSSAVAGTDANPPVDELKRVFAAVQQQVLAELPHFADEDLNVEVDTPHPAFSTKFEAIEFSPYHEMVHAGQIGLLRRLMGKNPVR